MDANSNASNHTAQLYEDISDDDFSDANSEFIDEVARLEREYFDSLDVEDVFENPPFRENYTAPPTCETLLTDFERQHLHLANVTLDRPCSAYFKTDTFMLDSEIFDTFLADGFRPEHVRCLQHKPTGEVFLTFHNQALRDAFLQKSSFISRHSGRWHVPNTAKQSLTFLTLYDAPYELPDLAIIHHLSPNCQGTYKSVQASSVFNGLRHYRVRPDYTLPSYLRYCKFLIRLYHDGQPFSSPEPNVFLNC